MIDLHDEHTAPEPARPVLTAVREANGFVPNMFRALANSPSTLTGFMAMMRANDTGSLTPMERQIVQLTASIENRGGYCVAGHTTFADGMGLPTEPIEAIRRGQPLADPRYQGLVDFTRAVVRNRGHVSEADTNALRSRGFGTEQILEVITGVALKTITNYVGSVFDLPLDREFQAHAWSDIETGETVVAATAAAG